MKSQVIKTDEADLLITNYAGLVYIEVKPYTMDKDLTITLSKEELGKVAKALIDAIVEID